MTDDADLTPGQAATLSAAANQLTGATALQAAKRLPLSEAAAYAGMRHGYDSMHPLLRRVVDTYGAKFTPGAVSAAEGSAPARAALLRATPYVARGLLGVGRAVAGPEMTAGTLAYGATRGVIDRLPTDVQDRITDTVGGTINQAALNLGIGGTDDSAYLASRARGGLTRRGSFDNVAAGSATQAAPTTAPDYAGTLAQRYEQALGAHPRYVSPDAGTQRLNQLYDQSFGYAGVQRRAAPTPLADTYMKTPPGGTPTASPPTPTQRPKKVYA